MANPSLTGSTPPAHPVFPPPVLTQRTVQLINSAFNTVAALPHAQHSVVDSVPTGDKSHDGDSDDELLAAANAYDEQSATASSAQMAAGGGVGPASWLSGPHKKQSATASAHMPAGVGVGPGTQPSGPSPFPGPVVSPVAGSRGALCRRLAGLSPAVSTCRPGVPTVAQPAQKAAPDPKRPRVGPPLPTTATGLLDFQQASRHPPELFAGLDYSSVVGRAAPPAAQSAHHVVLPYQGLSALP